MDRHYEVIVGNVGTVYHGPDREEAESRFAGYMDASLANVGRAGGEPVILMCDGEPIQEHEGTNQQD